MTWAVSRPAKCVCLQGTGQKVWGTADCKIYAVREAAAIFNPFAPLLMLLAPTQCLFGLPQRADSSSKLLTPEQQCCGLKQPCRAFSPLVSDYDIKGFHCMEKVSICRLNKYFSCSFLLFSWPVPEEKEKKRSTQLCLHQLAISPPRHTFGLLSIRDLGFQKLHWLRLGNLSSLLGM